MNQKIENYLAQLKNELSGSDPAVIQDALADTEEHLRTALDSAAQATPDVSEGDALETIIKQYGQPDEVATAYKEAEALTTPSFSGPARRLQESPSPDVSAPPPPDTRPFYKRFFGVVLEPRAWGSLFYLFFAMFTGIFYFTWVVTGMSMSFGLMVMIIGIPFTGLFILSVRGLSLIEGRIVEALLGVRMPRRPVFQKSSSGWWQAFKDIISDRHTWLSIVYFLLQMPLGIMYFTLFVTIIALAGAGIAVPILHFGFDIPVAYINGVSYYLSAWLMPLVIIGGILLAVSTMHLAKAIGAMHGSIAKALLVRI